MILGKVALIFDDKVRPDTTGIYCRRALGQLVDVEHFLPAELSHIPRQAFDLFLTIDDGLEYRLPPDLRPCAWWAIDTHLNYDRCRNRAGDFDFVFTAQRDGAEHMRRDGIASVSWLPLACDPEIHCKHDLAKQYDVCFVGSLFPGPRTELIDLIRQHFANVFVGHQFFEEMARIYSASRVVFNRSIRNDINMRVFEALGCGSLLLTNDLRDNGQEELFHDGLHLATYRDAPELLDKIKYYLKHDEVRERVAAAGREEALLRHTYRHRMARLLGELEKSLSQTCVVVKPHGVAAPHSLSLVDFPVPDLLDMIPRSSQRILHIVRGAGHLDKAIKARHEAEVVTIETVREDLDLAPASFDVIVCSDGLQSSPNPIGFLRKAGSWLKPTGLLLTGFANPRHYGVVKTLLDGHWPAGSRWFTRREIEKLFYRSESYINELRPVPKPGDEDFRDRAQAGKLQVGGLTAGGLQPEEAEEFYAAQFLVSAGPIPPRDWGLTSIVILTHNELAYTQKCLESIHELTDEPYELLLVDNGSTDGTVEYLQSLANSPSTEEPPVTSAGGDGQGIGWRVPAPIKLIRNDKNVGFAKAANQGIQAATGRHILLLNNDCVVTTGWLRRLLRALYTNHQIGLVGPCSNFVSGEQQVEVGYDDLLGLDGFAWDFGKANNCRMEETDRLVGFCLLIRRELIDAIGLLDERFGIGCFEDDDYCRRAVAAGFKAVIARDAFVHHFGGRTFIGMGVDFGALTRRNQGLLAEKWQKQPPVPVTPAPLQADNKTGKGYSFRAARGGGLLLVRKEIEISLCMIARDNASTLRAALTSIKPWVDEMIVVDTGSKDNTPEIAQKLGARVFHFPWPDSFAIARNESLRHARGRWIFWMDSDDTIDAANGAKLREVIRQVDSSVLGIIMAVHCPGAGAEAEHDLTIVTHVKLFRNLPQLRFQGRIHEQILGAIRRARGEVAWSDLYVVHSGYDHSVTGQEKKKDRDLHLLHLELQEQPDHPFTLFNLGMTYSNLGQHQEAVKYLQRSIQNSESSESHLRKTYALLAHSHLALGNWEAAWEACRQGLHFFPQDVELHFRRGMLMHEAGRLQEAIQAYQSALDSQEAPHFFSVSQGIKGFITRLNMAVVYRDMGDLARAEEQLQKVVEEMPQYQLGWRGLGEVLVRAGKLEEAEQIKKRLLADRRLHLEGALLESQLAECRGDFEAARRTLEGAVKKHANELAPLQALCRVLFHYAEPAAAEEALRELARRDPQDASTLHNLGVVCLRQVKSEDAIAAFQESLRLRPKAPQTYLQLGHALQSARKTDQAVAAWEESLRLSPGNPDAINALEQLKEPTSQKPSNALALSLSTPLPARTLQMASAAGSPVDQAILHEIWEQDSYGVSQVASAPDTDLDAPAHIGSFSALTHQTLPQARIIALSEFYRQRCNKPSDINEHCPTLCSLAMECRHVTEMGTRTGVSTTAFLFAQPDKLVCYDLRKYPQVDQLQALAGRTEFVFHLADVLKVVIEKTDLLFIDTLHDYEQLQQELFLHANRVRKYVVLHDTTTFAQCGETRGHRGLWPAVEEFLALGTFRLKRRYENNNGLTILERLEPSKD